MKASWKALGPRERAHPPPGEAVQPAGVLAQGQATRPHHTVERSAAHSTAATVRELLSPIKQLLGLGLLPLFPCGTSPPRLALVALPTGLASLCESRFPAGGACRAAWAQVHPVVSRPFLASCSGSVLGSRPHSSVHSVLFRAFSPTSPCFRFGKVRETLPSVVAPWP